MTLTRTQKARFQQFAEEVVQNSYANAGIPLSEGSELIAAVKTSKVGERMGEVILKHCTFSEFKQVDEFLKSEVFERVLGAIDEAVASVGLDETDSKQFALSLAMYLDTMSRMENPEGYEQAKQLESDTLPALVKITEAAQKI
ncbi:hypothetical protein [Pseudomonas sp. p1(2021b)]|uniref:DUF7375 domain-containing protein n=1 Tax=Pseudomonas sp. p1(2021b) TaxID=2874628 RepID=UPI003D2BDC5C